MAVDVGWRQIEAAGMFEKEAWLMAAVVLVPIVVGLVLAIIYPLLKAHGYVG